MTALHDALARIEHDAASDFTSTRLAHDLSPVTHAVRRARVARASATAVAAVAVVASGSWAAQAWRNTPDAGPATLPTPDSSLAGLPAPLGQKCETRAAKIDPSTVADVNGEVPLSSLCVLWDGTTLLRADAAVALEQLNIAYSALTGLDLCIYQGYRDTAQEQEFVAARGAQVYEPGTSAHGWGLAVDLCSSQLPDLVWLESSARALGWTQPAESVRDNPWHWEFDMAYAAMLDTMERQELPIGRVTIHSRTAPETIANSLALTYDVSPSIAQEALRTALPDAAAGRLDGWIVPGDYSFDSWTTLEQAVEALVATREDQLRGLGVPEDDWARLLIRASLVEAETPWPANMPLVARVIQNRLDLAMPLQLDSTVHFVSGSTDQFVTADERLIDSPYNTYLNTGLPPGPIATPSLDAIEAVLNPAEGEWLYFVVVDLETGEMKLATNIADHFDNVKVLNDWIEANAG
jgi:UPF0755 protein